LRPGSGVSSIVGLVQPAAVCASARTPWFVPYTVTSVFSRSDEQLHLHRRRFAGAERDVLALFGAENLASDTLTAVGSCQRQARGGGAAVVSRNASRTAPVSLFVTELSRQ